MTAPEPDGIAGLILRIAAGDRVAFRALYRDAAGKLFALLLRMLGNRAEAEDALQDTFARIWTAAARYDAGKGRGMTWLITLARNQALDRLRARPPAAGDDAAALEAVADPAPGPEAAALARGEARRIEDCLGTLDPDRAAAVRGAYLNGLSYEELARRHRVPLNTMRTWLRRSLIRLRECLEG